MSHRLGTLGAQSTRDRKTSHKLLSEKPQKIRWYTVSAFFLKA